MERITSDNNPRIKRLCLLEAKAGWRQKTQSFVIEGRRLVEDAPASAVQEVFLSESFLENLEHNQAVTPHNPSGIPGGNSAERTAERISEREIPRCLLEKVCGIWADRTVVLPDALFRKVSDTQTPQGILAVVRAPHWTWDDLLVEKQQAVQQRQPPLLLILEHIQDPGNLGTMFRTAEAAGATGIIMSHDCVDLFNPKTVRATMSSVFRVPYLVLPTDALPSDIAGTPSRAVPYHKSETGSASGRQHQEACHKEIHNMPERSPIDSLPQLLHGLKEIGIRSYAAYLDPFIRCYYDGCDYREGTAFLVGNEGNGLSRQTAAAADLRIMIPMEGRIESLNAAMSAGILLYEARRQRRQSS